MSNTIPPFRQAQVPDTATAAGHTSVPSATQGLAQSAAPSAAQSTAPSSAPSAAPAQTDSVTLSAAAQSGARLLTAAQGASGIDHAAVATIRAQLAAGSYNVSPENLAQAIATVLKETKS